MPWCPNCKDEYKEGIRVCADCGAELVDDLSFVASGRTTELPPGYDPEVLFSAASALAAEGAEEFAFDNGDEEEKTVYRERYVNNEEKAEDNRTSAFTLLSVGSIGLVIVVLFFLGIIAVPMSAFSRFMISGVMGVLFLLFLVMGVVSLKNFKTYRDKADEENSLTDEIRRWCKETLSAEEIDRKCVSDGTAEELKYFARSEYIKRALKEKFVNLDEAYAERLLDELYGDLYDE